MAHVLILPHCHAPCTSYPHFSLLAIILFQSEKLLFHPSTSTPFTLYLQKCTTRLDFTLHFISASSWITSASLAYPLSIHVFHSSKQHSTTYYSCTSASVNSLIKSPLTVHPPSSAHPCYYCTLQSVHVNFTCTSLWLAVGWLKQAPGIVTSQHLHLSTSG